MTRARRTSALFAAALLAVGACGGGGDDTAGPKSVASAAPASTAVASAEPATAPSDDAAQITTLARSVLLADKVGNICRESVSARLVTTVFGTVRKCEKSWVDEKPEDRVTAVDVSDVQVHDLAATATITQHGGVHEGAKGTWAFIRVDDDWRLWGVDYLRSMFATLFRHENFAEAEEGNLFSYPEVITCYRRMVERQDDEEFRRSVHRMMREGEEAQEEFDRYLTPCSRLRDSTGLTALRRSFEVGLRTEIEKAGVSPLTNCISRRLRVRVPDERLRELIAAGAEGKKTIHSRMRDALLDCALKDV
jgi:hypothetical protein